MKQALLNYRVEGSGRPLLLVHGFGISFNIWERLVPLLRSHFTLVMIELPGIGKSPIPGKGEDYVQTAIAGIESVRRAAGLDQWSVLGYSSGSRIAEAYVQSHASQVYRAIFLCPVQIDLVKTLMLRVGFWVDTLCPAAGSWVLSGWRLRFLISLYGFDLRPNPLASRWYAEISSAPVGVLMETLRLIVPIGRRPFSVPVPFSLIWGDSDIVPAAPRKPGAQDHFVHAPHAAPLMAAPEIAAAVLAILK